MKILYLYNKEYALPLARWLEEKGHRLNYFSDPLTVEDVEGKGYDLAVSYSYRHIVSGEVICALEGNIVNLHISLLPFNRGANPNEWAFLEGTPQGVTIHYMDERLDKGRIIAQRPVCMDYEDTLAQCYNRLHAAVQELFRESFAYYAFWPEMAKLPLGKGTYHSVADFAPFEGIWRNREIKVRDFLRLARGEDAGFAYPARGEDAGAGFGRPDKRGYEQ